MRFCKKALCLGVLAACADFGAALAETALPQQLVEQAQYWQGRGRADLAVQAWNKLLLSEPERAEALIGLGTYEAQAGRADQAEAYLARLAKAHPGHSGIKRVQEAIAAGRLDPNLLSDARRMAQAGQADEAVVRYRRLLAGARPRGDLALEYYQTVGGTRGGWDEAREGLSRLVAEQPDEPRYALALAQHLTYRDGTRRRGINMLSDLSQKPSVASQAKAALRQGLIWLWANPGDEALFRAYLAQDPKDEAVRKRLAELSQPSATGPADRFASRREQGYQALQRGDARAAEARFQQILKDNPKDADALGGMGVVRLRQQRYAEARELLQRAAAAPGGRAKWGQALASARFWELMEEAKAARAAGRPERAQRLLQQAMKISPRDDAAQVAMGDLLAERGQFKPAEDRYRQVIRKSPQNVEAIRGLIGVLAQQQRDSEAMELYNRLTPAQQALIGSVGVLRANRLRAQAKQAAAKGDYASARTILEEALKLDPDNPWTRFELARVYQHGGEHEKARSLMEGLIASDSAKPEALYAKALLSAENGQWQEGLKTLERIPRGARTEDMHALQRRLWMNAQAERAAIHARRGERQAARDILRQMEAAAGDDQESLAVLADAYADVGDSGQALALMRRLTSDAKQPSAGIRLRHAGVLLKTQQDAELVSLLQQLGDASDLSEAQRRELANLRFGHALRRAEILRESGDLAGAYDALAPVLAENPGDPRLQTSLARMHNSAGDHEEAVALYEAVLARHPNDMDVRIALVGAELDRGNAKRAEALVNEGLRQQPENPRVVALAGRVARARGDDRQALVYFRRAQALERAQPPARGGRSGNLMLRLVEKHTPPNPAKPVNPIAQGNTARDPTAAMRLTPASAAESQLAVAPRRGEQQATGSVVAAGPARGKGESTGSAAPGSGSTAPWTVAQSKAGRQPRRQLSLEEEIAEIRAPYASNIAGALSFRRRSGEEGLSRLYNVEVPIQARIATGDYGSITLRAVPVIVDAGDLDLGDVQKARRFGSNSLGLPPGGGSVSQRETGVALGAAYHAGPWRVDVGTTPINFPVVDAVGGIRWRPTYGRLSLGFDLSRRAVTESLLSYSGTRDTRTGDIWGGVRSTGVRFDAAYDLGGHGVYSGVGYRVLTGKRVASNNQWEFGGGWYWHILDETERRLTSGVNLTAFGYSKNLGSFTLGHGGYFSPKNYLALGVPLELVGRSGKLSYQARGTIGVQHFKVSDSPYFPHDPGLQSTLEALAATDPTLGAAHSGRSRTGIGYSFLGALEYRLAPYWHVGGQLGFDNARGFNQQAGLIFLRYWFEPQTQPMYFPPRPVPPFYVGDPG
jgi:tetratricopeptide (TPR) repeat protein